MRQYYTKTGVRLELIQGGKSSQKKPTHTPPKVDQNETPWWAKLKSVLSL